MPRDSEQASAATLRHIDHVGHDWHSLREYLIARLSENDPRAGKSGDYSHFSEPHTMEECPYAEAK